ncbi:hypothetical protein [Thiolapillus sp.]|uniref:hypothetical protein n=1 Tax=Thiolapillus sp. TaxID=2017437 RepID=UPI003AF88E88
MRTTGKQCGLAATGDYQPSLRSPWLAAIDFIPQLPVSSVAHNACLNRWIQNESLLLGLRMG